MELNKQKTNLRPVWKGILDVYAPISTILSRNGISYWVAYGTTLGAVRHKGFIPWDDDFDICIPNYQMDRARKVLSDELPSYLKVVSIENTPELGETYFKVQDSRKEVVQSIQRESGTLRPHGIYVDIFPLDGIPDGKIARLRQKIMTIALYCTWNTRFNSSPRKTWRYYCGALLACVFKPLLPRLSSNTDVQELRKKWASQYVFGTTLKVGRYTGNYRRCYSFVASSAYFSETIFLDFEGIKVPVPKSYDGYLKSIYGDWQTLPPVAKRLMPSHEGLFVAPWKFGPTAE